jgi:cysteine-rich repeat protein
MKGCVTLLATCLAGCYGLHDRSGDGTSSDPAPDEATGVCGNGLVESPEECDDGNADDCDGCSNECRLEQALGLESGTGARAESDDLCLPDLFTIEMRFRSTTNAGSCYLLQQQDCFSVSTTHSLDLLWIENRFCSDPISPRPCFSTSYRLSVDPGSWHHLAVTFGCYWDTDSCDHVVYVDGEPVGEAFGSSESPSWHCLGPVTIGVPPEGSACSTIIDDVRISDRVIYTTSFDPPATLDPDSDTVALWSFDSEDGRIADLSRNGHDLLLEDGRLVPDECHSP